MLFRSFLASVRADGLPSLVEIVRSDNGGEFFGGEFESVCNELLIKQEFTPAYSPQFNGVAERGLGMIETAAMAARIQAKVLFGHVQLPETDKLWAEAMHWACEEINQTACSSNPDSKSPNRCGLVKLVLLDRIHSSSPRTVGGSDRLRCCRKVKAVFMLDLQEITRVTVIERLRGLVRFRKHEMSRGRPRRHVSLHRSRSCL